MANVQNVVAIPITPEQPKNIPNQQLFVYINKNLTGGRYFSGNAITGTSTTPTAYETGIEEAVAGDIYINTTGQMYICTECGDEDTALWVYSGVSLAGSKIYMGVYMNYTSSYTSPFINVNSRIDWANVGDVYLYTGAGRNFGNTFTCVTAGTPSTAEWVYSTNLQIIDYDVVENDEGAALNAYMREGAQTTYVNPSNNITVYLPSTGTLDMFNGVVSEADFVTGNNPTVNFVFTGTSTKYKFLYKGVYIDINNYVAPPNTEINIIARYNSKSMLCVILEIPA